MRRESGFSLIEMLITVALVASLIGVAMPAFNSFRDTLAQRQATSQLINDLRRARQTSVTRHRSVIIAFGNGVATTNITTYSLHTDLDGDRIKDSNEPNLTRVLPKRTRISSVTMSEPGSRSVWSR